MKKILIALMVSFLVIPILLTAQEKKESTDKKESTLASKAIDEKGVGFDKQILDLNKSIQDVIAGANMMSGAGIRTLPYQTDIIYGPDKENPKYVQIVKHIYIKDGLFSNTLIGFEEKILRIYSDGKTVNQIETIIKTKNFKSQDVEIVSVLDPSPSTESTDDVILNHTLNDRKLITQKKLGEILNDVDSPIRNGIKSEFVIPNLTILQKNLLFITESNKKGSKDADLNISEFLKKSTLY
jgi:hypothetical protein